jgi:hypothetical protein
MSDDQRELVGRLFELVDAPFHGALRALLAENAALKAEVAKANAERDEARREVCALWEKHQSWARGVTASDYAVNRGWDCFDAPHATDGPVQNGGA